MSTNPYELACEAFARLLISQLEITFEQIDAAVHAEHAPIRMQIREFVFKMDPASRGVVASAGKTHPPAYGTSLNMALLHLPEWTFENGSEQVARLTYGALTARIHEILHP
jgi:hypothetical protein